MSYRRKTLLTGDIEVDLPRIFKRLERKNRRIEQTQIRQDPV